VNSWAQSGGGAKTETAFLAREKKAIGIKLAHSAREAKEVVTSCANEGILRRHVNQ